jgi:intracellular multiplication protein IcmG
MANKEDKPDEYQYSSYEGEADYQATSTDSTAVESEATEEDEGSNPFMADLDEGSVIARTEGFSLKTWLLENKRIVFIILLAVSILILFHFFSRHPRVKAVVTTPAPGAVDNSVISGKIDYLAQQIEKSQSQVVQLSNQVAQLNRELSQAQTDQKGMKSAVFLLSKKVDAVSGVVASMHKKPAAPHKKAAQSAPKVTYYVRALMPGRAWLMGSDGISTSVTVGSQLLGYGRVTMIHVQTGQVSTSAGKVFSYRETGN